MNITQCHVGINDVILLTLWTELLVFFVFALRVVQPLPPFINENFLLLCLGVFPTDYVERGFRRKCIVKLSFLTHHIHTYATKIIPTHYIFLERLRIACNQTSLHFSANSLLSLEQQGQQKRHISSYSQTVIHAIAYRSHASKR